MSKNASHIDNGQPLQLQEIAVRELDVTDRLVVGLTAS